MKKMLFAQFLLFTVVLVAVVGCSQPVANFGAAYPSPKSVPPALPTLEQLLTMTLGAAGAFVFVSLFGWSWGYFVTALLSRLPWALPSWLSDIVVLLPVAAIAAAWNAFAAYVNVAFPGVLDQTVGAFVAYLVNLLLGLAFSARGGASRLMMLQNHNVGPSTIAQARSTIFLFE